MASTRILLTFEEFERLPDRPGKRELLKGEPLELPPAEFIHNEIAHRIYEQLRAALLAAHGRGEALDLGKAYLEMGYRLSPDAFLQPDVSVTHAGQRVEKYLGGAPAIAVEVISPSNTAEEMDLKTKLYFESGAREVWRIHRKTLRIVVHVPGKSHEVSDNQALTTALLPGFALDVRELFSE